MTSDGRKRTMAKELKTGDRVMGYGYVRTISEVRDDGRIEVAFWGNTVISFQPDWMVTVQVEA